jgi:hypothetical protein
MASTFACFANKWILSQTLLHHPFEVAMQKTIDKEYIKRTLMVSNKNVGCVFVYQFTAFNGNW